MVDYGISNTMCWRCHSLPLSQQYMEVFETYLKNLVYTLIWISSQSNWLNSNYSN